MNVYTLDNSSYGAGNTMVMLRSRLFAHELSPCCGCACPRCVSHTSSDPPTPTEAIRKRFHTFVNESVPVKDYYAAKGLAHVISAVAAPDAVFEEVAKALDAVAPVKAAA